MNVKLYIEKKNRAIEEVKTTSPEQNIINLSSNVLPSAEKSLLKRPNHLYQHLQILIGATYLKTLTTLPINSPISL